MTTLDRREDALEALLVPGQDAQFKAEAHRARLMGDWAGAQLGHQGDARAAYVDHIVRFAVATGGVRPLFERIRDDLRAGYVAVTDAAVHRRMALAMIEATKAVTAA